MKSKILLERHSDSIVEFKLNDAEGKNSFTSAFMDELIPKLRYISEDDELKVVIFSGLPSIFSAGADFETLQKLTNRKVKPTDILLPKILLDIPIPTIAAMEGHAVGGGLAFGFCADIVVLAEESRYGCSFMNMGFTPGMGMTHLMEHFMTPSISHELQYTGRMFKGKELIGKTHINHIVPKNQVMPTAIDLAERISEKNRTALLSLKRTLSMPRRQLFERTYTTETMMHEICFNNESILTQIEEGYVKHT